MSDLTFHWFLPTNGGDGRDIVGGGHGNPAEAAGRAPTAAYIGQVARSAEQLGFTGALTPTGAWCQDAWISTALVAPVSERLKFMVAFRPGLISPFLSAQTAGTYQNLTRGRLLLNVVVGGESHEQEMYGDFLSKEQRYERCDEFLTVVRRLWAGDEVTFRGQHLQVANAYLAHRPEVPPPLYFGGSSKAGIEVAAKHADVYLTWGEPPAAVAEKVWAVRAAAAEQGREIRFGLRVHVITRDTSAAAWAEAERLLARIAPADIERVQASLKKSESEGIRRMLQLNGGTKDSLEIYPNLWAGIGLVRGGSGTALVGSHQEVADLIEEYAAVGIEEFVLSGYPHLEEAYWFGEGVLPELARRGRWAHPAPPPDLGSAVPFGAPLRVAAS